MARKLAAAAAGTFLLCASLAAQALDDTTNRHKGFFLRLDAEGGYLKSSATFSGTDVSISGGAGGLGISIGGALIENLILYGHAYDTIAFNPTFTAGGTSTGTSNVSAGTVGYGIGICYYLMPANVYFSGTLAVTVLTANNGSTSSSTQAGPGGRIAIGKEWWVSDHWGLGIAGQLSFASNKDNSASGAPTWTTLAPTLAFSATFN